MHSSNIRGKIGERCVARYLRNNKYKIVGANYHTRFGEIDIIAQKDRYIAFVEVKTRDKNSKISPAEAVDTNKQEKLRKTAHYYTFLKIIQNFSQGLMLQRLYWTLKIM